MLAEPALRLDIQVKITYTRAPKTRPTVTDTQKAMIRGTVKEETHETGHVMVCAAV